MNGVLIPAVLMTVSSVSIESKWKRSETCPVYTENPTTCYILPFLKDSSAVDVSQMTNEDVTLSALSAWLIDMNPDDPSKAELDRYASVIRSAYSEYNVSIRR